MKRRQFLTQTSLAGAALSVAAATPPLDASPAQADPATPVKNADIVLLDALSLSAAIRARRVSCVEVMQAYLAHITAINPRFNAIVSLREPDVLLQEALVCDNELAHDQYRGWMHGFPHAAKDLVDVKGIRTSQGSPILPDQPAAADSLLVARIRKAGAIFIGKTNVPEFGFGSQSYNPVFGATLNAWDGKSTAGGSSGGAAASLALRMLPVADGSDYMGSLRNPAAFNNVIGFRPTLGRVPDDADFLQQMSTAGPMGRTVSDTAMLLSTIAGYDDSAPLSLTADPAQFRRPLAREMKGMRIGWLGDFNGYLAMQDGVLSLCRKALDTFADIGCHVEDITLPYPMEKLWQTWLTLRHWSSCGGMYALYESAATRALLKPEIIWEIEGGLKQPALAISQATAARAEWYLAVRDALHTVDFLVLPTAQVFAFDATTHWPARIGSRTMDTYHRWMEVVIPGTLSGCPVVNVPAGFGPHGLSMGLQIIGPMHQDLSVLQMAFAYEQASRWNLDRLPPALQDAQDVTRAANRARPVNRV